MITSNVLMSAKKINKVYGHGKKAVHAVKDVDYQLFKGEIVSIVGESGSGKTTLAKMMMGLLPVTDGHFIFHNHKRDISNLKKRKSYWQQVQAIFQDPFSSFNEFYKVESLLLNCFKLKNIVKSKEEKIEKMKQACLFVNLDFNEVHDKHAFELSGGQMQRVMIARIFLIQPDLLIADEPTSMIDACSRATILEMLLKLRDENKMTIIFVTHDLGLAYFVSDRVFIMEQGRIVERGTAQQIIGAPNHPYTKQLISDVPKLHEAWDIG